MGDIFGGMSGGTSSGSSSSGLGGLASSLGSLLGGGQPASGGGGDASSLLGGGGTDIFSSLLGSGTGGLLGMDPSVGASYAMQGGGGGGGAGGYQDPGQQGGDPSEPQPPIQPPQQPTRQAAYQPPTAPTDPQAWQAGGGGSVKGPTGFLPAASIDRRFPDQTPVENIDRRFPYNVPREQGPVEQGIADKIKARTDEEAGVSGPGYNALDAAAQPPSAAETPTEPQAQPDQQPPAPTARPPAQPGVPQQGGVSQQRGAPQQFQRPMPNMGRLFQDIQGAMSGNPMSLMNLAQTVMGMAGGQQGGQQGGMPPWMPGYGPGQPYGTQLRPQDRPGLQQALDYYRRTGQVPPNMQQPRAGQQPGQQPGESFEAFQQRQQQSQNNTPEYWGAVARGETPPQGQAPALQPSGDANAPTRQPDGRFPSGYQQVAPIISRTLSSSGLPDRAIKGILFNIRTESDFNPTLRHPDQPRFGGEAHYAHGLYQEGGEEWNRYHRWLGGRDWRDPQLQTQFIAQNMKQNYPRLWTRLQNAQSPEEAARLFARDYLKPSNRNLIARFARINRGI